VVAFNRRWPRDPSFTGMSRPSTVSTPGNRLPLFGVRSLLIAWKSDASVNSSDASSWNSLRFCASFLRASSTSSSGQGWVEMGGFWALGFGAASCAMSVGAATTTATSADQAKRRIMPLILYGRWCAVQCERSKPDLHAVYLGVTDRLLAVASRIAVT